MKRHTVAAVIVIFVHLLWAAGQDQMGKEQSTPAPREIVFVCEHGAALSVISAAYFNKLAKEQHLNMHAIARGIDPQANLSLSADAGLKNDKVVSEVQKPRVLSQEDLQHADYVVTFFPIPQKYAISAPVESWNDVPPTAAGYGKSRDAILQHMRQLLKALRTKAQIPDR